MSKEFLNLLTELLSFSMRIDDELRLYSALHYHGFGTGLKVCSKANLLHYPLSVKRFYKQEGYRLMWVLKDTLKTPAWNAMLLLDCVLQYGLNPINYHPRELTYVNLHIVQAVNANDDKARFNVILTIITLINNLHYGKSNPCFDTKRIDAQNIMELKGDKILIEALEFNDL